MNCKNISEVSGNILETKCDIICQQVNCKGVMGAGLALQIRKKWPKVYNLYHTTYDSYCLGNVQFVPVDPCKFIANIFGQDGYGRTGIHTDYAALESGLIEVLKLAKSRTPYLSVAIPYGIGCGLAGGDWARVITIIEKVFSESEVCVEITKYS